MSLRLWMPLMGDLRNQGLDIFDISILGTISWVNGKLGEKALQAGNANQTSNGVLIDSNLTDIMTEEYSVSVWVKPLGNHVHYNGTILSSGDWNKVRWAFGVNQNNTKVDILCNGHNTYLDCAVLANEWTHLICTCDSTNRVYLYKNGELIGSSQRSDKPASDSSKAAIGRETYASGYFSFNGVIQDLRLYDHCLSSMEIKRLSQGLILHYPLNREGWGQENLFQNDCLLNSFANQSTQEVLNVSCWASGAYNTTQLKSILLPNETYTFSYDVECTALTSVPTVFSKQVGFLLYSASTGSANRLGQATPANVATVGAKTHVSVTWTMPSSIPTDYTLLCYTNRYTTNGSAPYGYDTFTFSNIKLEKGSIETPWCPNSSDVLATTMGLNSTTEYDCSGYGNNGEKIGNLTYVSNTPKYSVSTHITDGANTRISTPTLTFPNNSLTLNIWFRSTNTSPTGNYHMVIDSVANRQWYEMCINYTGFLRAGLYINGTRYADNCTSKTALDGNWHMLTMTYDGAIIKRYFDGAMEKSTSITATTGLSSPTAIMLGRDGPSASYACIDADLSDFRIYATALSANDVRALYENSGYITNNGTTYAYEFIEE